MKKSYVSVVVIILLVAAGGCLLALWEKPVTGITYEVVTTPEAQELGLGGRTEVPHNYGMLFVFSKAAEYTFWMKDMLVPIDILWLSDKGTVLKIDANVATSTYPAMYAPPEPVRLVLEMRAGEARVKGIRVGSRVAIPANWQK
jgi:uncharacterized protein